MTDSGSCMGNDWGTVECWEHFAWELFAGLQVRYRTSVFDLLTLNQFASLE